MDQLELVSVQFPLVNFLFSYSMRHAQRCVLQRPSSETQHFRPGLPGVPQHQHALFPAPPVPGAHTAAESLRRFFPRTAETHRQQPVFGLHATAVRP